MRTIEGLAMAIEAKDQNTHDHLFRVRNFVEEMARELNLSSKELQALHTASFLHDIGKLAVPEHIVNKPGKLTPEEFEKMKIHPVVGANILERVRFPYPVVPIVRSHHEWWNGRGYPDGLVGEDIPIGARILTVADCFDALVSDRPYRKGMSMESALELVKSLSGTQFDPAVVEVLEKLQAQRQESNNQSSFTALDTEIEVSRGAAPGAGFEQQMESAAPLQPALAGSTANSGQPTQASLHLIAAASQEAQTLFELSQTLGSTLRFNETIAVMASRLRRLIPCDACALYVKRGDELFMQHIDGENVKAFSADAIPMGQGISGWVAQYGKASVNGNAAVEPNYNSKGGSSGSGSSEELRSAISIPLFDLKQQVFAVLTLYSCAQDGFKRDHLRILQAMEGKLALFLQNPTEFRRVECDTETDFLTSLPNARNLFLHLESELKRCSEQTEAMAVIVCDLNAFRQVNDRCGHLTGNLLLETIAEAFLSICRPGEYVARRGGDEFVFVLPGTDEHNSGARLRSITECVASACHRCPGVKVQVTASLGVSFFPADSSTAVELLALADRRMYLDKRAHYERDPVRDNLLIMGGVAV